MKRIFTFFCAGAVMIALCAGIFACRDDNTKEKEPEGVSLDEALRGNAPELLVPKESLPQWLIDKIDVLESYGHVDALVFKGKWNGRAIYRILNVLNSCLICDYYYENGENIKDAFGYEAFLNILGEIESKTNKSWVVVYKVVGLGLFTRSEFADDEKWGDDEYEFPIKPGTPE